MKRRQVITGLFATAAAGLFSSSSWRKMSSPLNDSIAASPSSSSLPQDIIPPLTDPVRDRERSVVAQLTFSQPVEEDGVAITNPEAFLSTDVSSEVKSKKERVTDAQVQQVNAPTHENHSQTLSGDWFDRSVHFDEDYVSDIYVSDLDRPLLLSVHLRLKHLQSMIGYGNFNIVSFDDALSYAKRFSKVGQFTTQELAFIDSIFSYDAKQYGFYGDKVTDQLTYSIAKPDVFKVPYTGHYLFNEQSFAYYEKIRQSVGEGIVLTSGVRAVVKQLHLFLAKVISVDGNYSRASRSLAPPGYSYHGIGDFDVGRKGWGHKNFTDAFSETVEFKRMLDLGYVAIRYDHGNKLGVRFEPWHIQVV